MNYQDLVLQVAVQPRVQLARIESEAYAMEGQHNRSSQNFGTDMLPENCSRLLWEVDSPHKKTIRFNVMEDKFMWRDPVHLFGIGHGDVTKVVRDGSLSSQTIGGQFSGPSPS